MQGIVKFFKHSYGFIVSENKEYFVHFSNIKTTGFRKLENGQKVTFDVGLVEGNSREQAINVVPLQTLNESK
jgi:CspA family cold shock protein